MTGPPKTPEEAQALREGFEVLGPKGLLAKAARRYLRTTPEYAAAKREGRAKAWLEAEAYSMADYLYLAMTTRDLED